MAHLVCTCYLLLIEKTLLFAQTIANTYSDSNTLANASNLRIKSAGPKHHNRPTQYTIDPNDTQSSLLIDLAIDNLIAKRMITARMKVTMRKYKAISMMGA